MATKRELALRHTKNKNRRLASLLQSGVRDGSLFHVLTRNYIGLRDEVQDARYDHVSWIYSVTYAKEALLGNCVYMSGVLVLCRSSRA